MYCTAEYYFDTDPGYGNGIPIEGSFDSSNEDIQFDISLPDLSLGHTCSILKVHGCRW